MVKQRGSAFGIKIVYLVYKIFGFWAMKLLLRFVAFYFALTTPKIKKDLSKIYTLCGKKYGFLEHWKHIYSFALVFTDRFLSKTDIKYRIELQNEDSYIDATKDAMMMLNSHIGDWHVCAKYMPKTEQKLNIVMKEAVKKEVREFQDQIASEESYNVIDIGEGFFSYGVKIANALKNKEAVSIMVDRFLDSGKYVDFLGQSLLLHDTPFALAYSQGATMFAVFSIRISDFSYRTSLHQIVFDKTLKKDEAIQKAMQEYACLLEKYTRQYTNQWFNHYDIFEQGTKRQWHL